MKKWQKWQKIIDGKKSLDSARFNRRQRFIEIIQSCSSRQNAKSGRSNPSVLPPVPENRCTAPSSALRSCPARPRQRLAFGRRFPREWYKWMVHTTSSAPSQAGTVQKWWCSASHETFFHAPSRSEAPFPVITYLVLLAALQKARYPLKWQ